AFGLDEVSAVVASAVNFFANATAASISADFAVSAAGDPCAAAGAMGATRASAAKTAAKRFIGQTLQERAGEIRADCGEIEALSGELFVMTRRMTPH
ncbi:MAG TPA: hypothetical protein DDZ68_07940, partial [Parvularcula sp.]|nr:hypothetical protein [Parvularcula sp.]HBS32984.1 hypothetical protein [Parvularcula sp.]